MVLANPIAKLSLENYLGYMSRTSLPRILIPVSACITMLLGFLVIIDWYTQSESLIQILSAFVPMQFHTALGFLMSGLAIVGLLFQKKRVGLILAVLVSVLGLITLTEYLINLDLGVDEFFMEYYIQVKPPIRDAWPPIQPFVFCCLGYP